MECFLPTQSASLICAPARGQLVHNKRKLSFRTYVPMHMRYQNAADYASLSWKVSHGGLIARDWVFHDYVISDYEQIGAIPED